MGHAKVVYRLKHPNYYMIRFPTAWYKAAQHISKPMKPTVDLDFLEIHFGGY